MFLSGLTCTILRPCLLWLQPRLYSQIPDTLILNACVSQRGEFPQLPHLKCSRTQFPISSTKPIVNLTSSNGFLNLHHPSPPLTTPTHPPHGTSMKHNTGMFYLCHILLKIKLNTDKLKPF